MLNYQPTEWISKPLENGFLYTECRNELLSPRHCFFRIFSSTVGVFPLDSDSFLPHSFDAQFIQEIDFSCKIYEIRLDCRH